MSGMRPSWCASCCVRPLSAPQRSDQTSRVPLPVAPVPCAGSRNAGSRHVAMTAPAHTAPCRSRTGTDTSVRLVGWLCTHPALSSAQTAGRFLASSLLLFPSCCVFTAPHRRNLPPSKVCSSNFRKVDPPLQYIRYVGRPAWSWVRRSIASTVPSAPSLRCKYHRGGRSRSAFH